MRRCGAFALAALLCTAAAPSYAAIEHLGSVTFSVRDNHDTTYTNFRGDRVALTARDGDVFCNSVDASFDNARVRSIWRGNLRRGQTVSVDLPGGARNVDRIDFNCHPMNSWRAQVDVAANKFVGERFGYGYGHNPVQGFFNRMFGR